MSYIYTYHTCRVYIHTLFTCTSDLDNRTYHIIRSIVEHLLGATLTSDPNDECTEFH